MCAELSPVSCASHVQWSSPLRRLTTVQSCCQASNLVIRSMTPVPQCLWQCMWHSSFQMDWNQCFTQAITARNPVWWWLLLASPGQHHQSAWHASLGPLTFLRYIFDSGKRCVFNMGQCCFFFFFFFFCLCHYTITLLYCLRWVTLPLVHACLISSSTRVSSEQSPVTSSRLTHWPSWWNTLAGLG